MLRFFRVFFIGIISFCLIGSTKAQVDTASVLISNVTCNGGTNGSIRYNITGGPGPVKYTWSNGVSGYATGTCTYAVNLNNPGSALSQFQVRVDVTLATGINANFSDIVFIDSAGNAYPFWLTDFPTPTTATFWVRVPAIPSGTSVFYLSYCGNAVVSQSNPVTTFEFFDNFDTGNIAAWAGTCINIDVAGESCASSATNTQSFSPAYSLYLTGASSCFTPPYSGAGSRVTRTVPMVNDSLVIDYENRAAVSLYGFCSGGTGTNNQAYADGVYLGTGQSVSQGGSCATNTTAWATSTSQAFAVSVGSTALAFQTNGGDCDNSQGWYDNVRVRKYRTYPPLVTLDTTPQLSLNNLSAGTYTLTLVDINGVTVTRNIVVTQPVAIQVNIDSFNNPCAGANAGSAWVNVANGTPPYTLLWSTNQSTDTITGLAPGAYSITVTDNNGCTATAATQIIQIPALQATANADSVLCFGTATGAAWAVATGGQTPYSYLWSNGLTTDTITGIAVGNFTVTVTDANFCSASASATVSQPAALSAPANSHAALCVPPNSGSAVVSVTGGSSPFSYNWSTGGVTDSVAALTAGNYTVTVTDAHNCTITQSVTVASFPPVSVTLQQITPACPSVADGGVSIQPLSGTAPYTFIWSDGETTQNAGTLNVGPASVTVTDAAGCSATLTATVPLDNFTVTVSAQPDAVVISGTEVTLQVHGTGVLSAVWSPFVTFTDSAGLTVTVTPAVTTLYTVAATSVRGCTDTVTAKVLVQPKPEWLVPTAFSPNGDGVNDVFHAILRGQVQLISLSIYNRWGEKVFESDNWDSGWNGTYQDIAQPIGVYVYILKVKDEAHANKFIEEKGNLTLVR